MLVDELIKFKGTRHGLLISFNEEGNFEDVIAEFKEKVDGNASFFKNAPISLDLGWRELTAEDFEGFYNFINENGLNLQGIISSSAYTRNIAEGYGIKVIIGRLGLAQHEGRIRKQKEKFKTTAEERDHGVDDKQRSILIKKTLRSGQKIKYSGNVVIIGDVNPGAEVEAGGDIVVWGVIRGIVHAGVPNKEDASIIGMHIMPTQMKIGNCFGIISYEKKMDENSIKVAQLKGAEIIVSNYKK